MSLYSQTLRKNFSIPLYYQLKQILLKEIQSGAYDGNIPLPPEMELAEKFQISRPTVRQAIGSLVNEGILTRTKGKGTYVHLSAAANQAFVHQMGSYNHDFSTDGSIPETSVLSLQKMPVSPKIAGPLEITEDSLVFELIRLRFSNHEPTALITTYIPAEIDAALQSRDFTRESLHQVFDALKLPIRRISRIFEVKIPTVQERELMQLPENIPLFHFTTTAYTTGQIPIEYSFSKYRGDKNKFFIELNR